MRIRLAAMITAVVAGGLLTLAASAPARAASASTTVVVAEADLPVAADTALRRPFEVIGRSTPAVRRSNKWAWLTAIAGAALVGASFPLAEEADRRYDAYLGEDDLARIDARFAATTRMDRLATGALLAGEGLLATAVWMRFVRGERDEPVRLSQNVKLDVRAGRCALAVRF